MGVHSLWKILEPSSRAVRLESLNKKQLAVDASIWIYQFLKAVRDKNGFSMSNSHIVGFFRRICKLLYFGIKPVFVFDGGVPLLKKQTIRLRKQVRQGSRDNAEKTAKRLLAIEMHKRAQQQQQQQQQSPQKSSGQEIKLNSGDINDEYRLPTIKGFETSSKDTRVLTDQPEVKTYDEQLDEFELEGIDLDSIDPNSKEFRELPLNLQYLIISQLRLKSRLRMGYTKDQLEDLFPNSLDFSKFQIEMVKKRNFFTQRLMNITGMDSNESVKRISSENDKQYKITKNEGGWSLSINKEGDDKNPIKIVDKYDERDDDEVQWEDVEFESVAPREDFSLNSLKLKQRQLTREQFNKLDDDLKEIEKLELRNAIEVSRNEYMKQQQEELKMLGYKDEENSKESNVVIVESEDDIEFEDLPLELPESKEDMRVVETVPKVDEKDNDDDDYDDVDFENLPFENIPPEPPKSKGPNEPKIQDYHKALTVDKNFQLSSMDSMLGFSIGSKHKDKPKIMESPTKKITKSVNLPAWFKEKREVTETSTNEQNENDDINKKKLSEPSKVHEEFVPWFEAQDIINKDNIEVIDLEEDDANNNDKSKNKQTEDIELVESPTKESAISSEDVREKSKSKEDSNVEEVSKAETNVEEPESRKPIEDMEYDFYESEEEELSEQLKKEEEEHEEFQKNLNPMIIQTLERESNLLKEARKQQIRDSDEVSTEMIKDIQELLANFGIPYITAPMEAEAQCAELLKLGLVDGIITDDSDVFLFGGDRIYKNMFHEKNYVEFYDFQRIEKNLDLDRNKLIELAHLLGSDYTPGLKGIGPVTSVEILNNFKNLKEFKNWFNSSQFDLDKQLSDTKFLKSLRKKLLKNDIVLDEYFPNEKVNLAYLKPEVDKDKTSFVWGNPDLDRLRKYLNLKVGWSFDKINDILVPLIQDINKKKRENQSLLTEFYPAEVNKKRRIGSIGRKSK